MCMAVLFLHLHYQKAMQDHTRFEVWALQNQTYLHVSQGSWSDVEFEAS